MICFLREKIDPTRDSQKLPLVGSI